MQTPYRYQKKTPAREKPAWSSTESLKGDPVQVFCRLKPLNEETEQPCITLLSPKTLKISTPPDSKVTRKDVQCVFRHIFTSQCNQKEIFEYVAYPLLEDLLMGKNGLLFSYGVTGSGKTYTLTGDQSNPGIMPRFIHSLFNSVDDFQAKKFIFKSDKMNGFEVQSEADAEEERLREAKLNQKNVRSLKKGNSENRLTYDNDGTKVNGVKQTNLYAVFISYVEIYNNTIFDLLDESNGKTLQNKILREDAQRFMYINNVTEFEVKSAIEAFDLFNLGQRRKRMGNTVLNSDSSRSHSIFNIRLVQLEQEARNDKGELMIPEGNQLKMSQLSFVDLAGSERCSRTQNTGMRLKEASSINNSLMSLRTCLEILRDNQTNNANRLVPYRDSRLTLLFKNYFEGEGNVKMIVCINPTVEDYEENLQVLKFSEMTQEVKVNKAESRYTPFKKKQKVEEVQTPVLPKQNFLQLTFGPKIPSFKLDFEDIDGCISTITRLSKILKVRKEKECANRLTLTSAGEKFRKRLEKANQKFVLNQTEIRSIKTLLKKEKLKSHNLELKLSSLETEKENLNCHTGELQSVITALKYAIDEKDLKINQNLLEKERTKKKLALQKERMNQEVDEHLKRQRDEFHAQMQVNNLKLQKVKHIIENDCSTQCNFVKTDTEVQTVNPVPNVQPASAPRSHHRNIVITTSKRRSRSAGDVWLEHNVVKPVPLGTVLQPAMKKRKSVTKLTKATDVTNPKQSKYCLMTQETDAGGDLETKLYKGDIVATCGGGAQVIFNDVERLRQQSPTESNRQM